MISNVRDYLEARLGVRTDTRVSADGVTLGVAAAIVFRQDPRRLGFSFVNLSPNIMYLTPVGTPSATKGFYLGPNGGTLGMNILEDGEIVAWEWLGIAGAPASPYYTVEALLVPAGETH
jgi:hypothetical protein